MLLRFIAHKAGLPSAPVSGQNLVEFGLVVGLVAVVGIGAAFQMGQTMSTTLDDTVASFGTPVPVGAGSKPATALFPESESVLASEGGEGSAILPGFLDPDPLPAAIPLPPSPEPGLTTSVGSENQGAAALPAGSGMSVNSGGHSYLPNPGSGVVGPLGSVGLGSGSLSSPPIGSGPLAVMGSGNTSVAAGPTATAVGSAGTIRKPPEQGTTSGSWGTRR
jgi:Flp pilus assembly pilin Flp